MTTDERVLCRDSNVSESPLAPTDCYPRLTAWEKQCLPLPVQARLDEARAMRETIEHINCNIIRVADALNTIEACHYDLADMVEKKIAPTLKVIAEEVGS